MTQIICSSDLLGQNLFMPETKEPRASQPHQIVLAKSPAFPLQICDLIGPKMIIVTGNETTGGLDTSQNGLEVVVSDDNRLTTILEHCKRRGICSILIDFSGNSADFEEIREGFEKNSLGQKARTSLEFLRETAATEEFDFERFGWKCWGYFC